MTATTAAPQIVFDQPQAAPDYDPALYQPKATCPTVGRLEDVDDDAVAFYQEHGYLSVQEVLTPDEVEASLQTLDDLVVGKQTGHRQTMFEAGLKDRDPATLTDDEKRAAVRKLVFGQDGATQCGLPVFKPLLVSVLRRLMGGLEPEALQVMTLLKPAQGGREKPWHQDHAYFNRPVDARVVGVWIALDEATVANGCMQLLDGGHQLGPMLHWKRRDWQLCDTEVLGKPSLAAPLPPGGALFFDSLLPHGTPTNHTPESRRAMQFHYIATDTPTIDEADRLAVFGTEGKDVTC